MSVFKAYGHLLLEDFNSKALFLSKTPQYKELIDKNKGVLQMITPDGVVLNMLLHWLNNGSVRLPEDKDKIIDTLQMFNKIKNKQNFKHSRDYNTYKTFSDLYQVVNETGESKDIKNNKFKFIAKSGIYSLYEIKEFPGENVLPKSWCVAYENTFNDYITDYEGCNFYYIEENGKPYSLIHTYSHQFKDVRDTEFPQIENNNVKALIEHIPANTLLEQYLNILPYDKVLEAVSEDGVMLEKVKPEFKTLELCKKAIISWAGAIGAVPKNVLNYDLCKLAVSLHGRSLQFIPKELITKELATMAVSKHGDAIEFVPKKLITKELRIAAANAEKDPVNN